MDVYVGVDVAKHRLDISVLPSGESWTTSNDEAAHAELVTRLSKHKPALIVLEATGGMQTAIAAALALARLPVAVVNPRQVRAFAQAIGQLAKTDRLDATLLARFGEATKPAPRPLPDEQSIELEALITRRRQLIQMLTAETNRKQSCPLKPLRDRIEQNIAWLREQIADIDSDLDDAIRRSPLWREQEDLLRSIPASGPSLRVRCSRSFPSWAD